MADPVALLEIDALRGGYGDVPVLHGVSITVNEGEVVGLLGHNGMGKSTLLRTVMGFLPATGGTLRFDGADITKMPPYGRARLGLGYVPQGRGIFPALSALDNLRFAYPSDADGEDDAIAATLRDFPRLEALLDRQAGQLSGGEQQILALARCLIAEPHMLLLDEPTEGIQPSIIEEIGGILSRLRKEQGLTILVVEQNLEFLTDLCDRLLDLREGPDQGRGGARRDDRRRPHRRFRRVGDSAHDPRRSTSRVTQNSIHARRNDRDEGDLYDRSPPDTGSIARDRQRSRHDHERCRSLDLSERDGSDLPGL